MAVEWSEGSAWLAVEWSEGSAWLWNEVRGLHGCGVTNDAGKELLGFLPTQQVTVCKTWFQKKEIHRVIWQHPKSKQWSCIDYVIMRVCDSRVCSDVTVKRGAECNTFLRASVRMAWIDLKKRAEININEGKRYVSGLVSCKESDDMSTGRPLQEQYIEEMARARDSGREMGSDVFCIT